MLDMIADYHNSKREDRRSAVAPQTTADLVTVRRSSGASVTTNFKPPSSADTTTKSTMDKTVLKVNASSSETNLTTMTERKPLRRSKPQVKEFHDVIMCSLCNGYLVNATSIDVCEHSFCRSCIVRHLEKEGNCPQCKPQMKHITVGNLRADKVLQTLVYKLVPGLIQQERERQLQFWKTIDSASDCEMLSMEDEFFYPAEPISLSLEYHPALLGANSKTQTPPVRYLQCPAEVTVNHLKRFLCYKCDIDPANERVDIDIIYEDEILPEDFSLIDVGYCYSWKRVAPMRFFYRILVHSNSPPSPLIRLAEVVTTPTAVRVSEKELSNAEAKRVKKSTDSEAMMAPAVPTKTVRFLEPARKVEKNGENNRQVTYSVFKSKSLDGKDSSGHFNNNNNNEPEREKNEGNGTMKMIIARKQSPKRSSSEESVYNITNDFKSLRSNDMRYSDYTVTSTTSGGVQIPKKIKEESKTGVSKCDIVVSIPPSQIQRSPNSSDESMENLSLAELKTAGKKSTSSSSASKKNVPKLKIELNSLKTKITIPKPKSAEVRQEPRKVSKRKLSIDEMPMSDKVDLKTYAKNIGLKPIDMERSVDLLEPSKPKTSPDASPMSTSSSTGSSHSNGTFSFSTNESCQSSSSSHKKRKKKHSKEPKDSNGKRRKLHAEISSQPADESLKMKVKITGSHNHRPHKVDARKSSSSSDEVIILPPTLSKLAPPTAASPQAPNGATVNGNDQRKSPKTAPSPPSQVIQPQAQIPSAANFNISNLNRTLSEESSNISNLMSGREAEVSKKPTEIKPKPSPPQIMTTIHSRISSNAQITSTTASKAPLPKPLSSIQDMKLPASPPLPPSLFKTTPLTIPTITATSTMAANPPKPVRTAMNPPTHAVGQSNRPPKLAPAAPKSQFAVPHPPPKSMPNSPKLCPIPSIASSAHKHAAQLKRSASLDGHPSSLLTKQQKIEQERMMRKPTYGPPMFQQQRHPRPPAKAQENHFYSSSMSSAYTHEMSKRKPVPMLMPPSSISVTKMSDTSSNKVTHTSPNSAVTITSQQKQHKSYGHQNNQKPALEIMCIPTSSDHKPASNKTSPPKATRPPPPPIPLVKIKKTQSQSLPVRSSSLTVNTKTTSSRTHASLPELINMRSNIPAIVASKSAAASAESAPKPEKPAHETNGKPPKEKLSLKDRRPSSKDGSLEILDLSGKPTSQSNPTTPTVTVSSPSVQPALSPAPSVGNSLEAALNKIKQNMTSSTVPDSIAAANKSPKIETSPEDLQNLHMLSESATNREKIAIKTLPKLNEISKVRLPQAPVRQQNASVRNIPNPSALAFRNQPTTTIPMLNSISTKPATPPSPSTAASQPEFKVPTPPSSSPTSSTNPGSPPRLKKNLNIEQVAANLNMRAAAAADRAEASSTATAVTTQATTTVPCTNVVSTSRQGSPTPSKQSKPAIVTSSNVVSSSSSSLVAGTVVASRESSSTPAVTPTPPKTSFKSISSLVAPSSSSSTVSAGTA